jgi:hypothetical protein
MKFLALIFLFFPLFLAAQNASQPVVDEQIQEKVKHRTYPGGQDESDLKVQAQLVNPSRKMAPVQEEPSEPSNDD